MYISPIIYENLRKNKLTGYTHNEVKSDAFSLGLVILEAALQKSVQKIYGQNGVEADELSKLLEELQYKHENNPLLYSSVQKLLEISEEERVDFLVLKTVMP